MKCNGHDQETKKLVLLVRRDILISDILIAVRLIAKTINLAASKILVHVHPVEILTNSTAAVHA